MPKFILLLCISFFMSACSTVNRGSMDHFRIDTVPQGAKVTTSIVDRRGMSQYEKRQSRTQIITPDTNYIGCNPTPCAIKLPRRSEFVATLEHPGYEPTEIFIRYSNLKAGSTASAAVNLASASGSGFAVAGFIGSMQALGTSLLSFGTQTVNASGIASSGAAAGLGVGVGMVAIDMASGANLNLFPNPVVIELAKNGTPIRKDPLVDLYWDMTEAENVSKIICAKKKKDRKEGEPTCKESKLDVRQKRTSFQILKKEQLETLKVAIKEAKEKQKAAASP